MEVNRVFRLGFGLDGRPTTRKPPRKRTNDGVGSYLCSLRHWRCCLMRASILAATSSQSLVRVSFWGVVKPLLSCGVSEQEKGLRWLLWARHMVAYCKMLSSKCNTKGWWGWSKSLLCSPPRLLGRRCNGGVTDRRPCCGWAGESSSHCWTCAGPSRGYTGTWPSSISPWCRCTSFCQRDSLLQISAAVKTGRTWLLQH